MDRLLPKTSEKRVWNPSLLRPWRAISSRIITTSMSVSLVWTCRSYALLMPLSCATKHALRYMEELMKLGYVRGSKQEQHEALQCTF